MAFVRRCAQIRDEGSTLVEIVTACLVISVAVIGLMGSFGAGMGLVGHSRQRSSGAEVAQERVENVHNIPYDYVGLDVAPTPTPGTPDAKVTADGRYEVIDANPAGVCLAGDMCEPLVTGGNVLHIEDPCRPPKCSTIFSIYQYVTWVDDPTIVDTTQDYKRVVVVVDWKYPVSTGRINQVTQSTFISKGSVTVPETSVPPTASPLTSAVPSAPPIDPGLLGIGQLIPGSISPPTPNPSNPCPGDTEGPTPVAPVVVSGSGTEQGYLASTAIQVRARATDTCVPITVEFSNQSQSSGWQSAGTMPSDTDTTVQWIIPSGDGTKTFWTRYKDNQGNYSGTYITYVILDRTSPTTPANFLTTNCSLESSSDRTVSFGWMASSDTNLSGYRVYQKIENGAWVIKTTTTATTATGTDKKTYNSLQYKVRAYDKAGNESGDSTIVTFVKNRC